MTDNTQPEALRLADEVDEVARTYPDMAEVSAELRRLHARIAEMEAQLASIGAGGVTGPLIDQPQAMPDLSQLTEREPVAIRPDIQAVLAMLDVPVIARMSSHEGKLLKPGQEPPAFESAVPLVREWDHRRACESIIAALSRNK